MIFNDKNDDDAAADDDDDDDVVWRVGMPKLTRLTCQRGKTLTVVGLSALGPHNRPPPPRAARCPYLHALRQKIAAACNGHRRCYVSSRDLRLTRKQCPGVAAVFIDVSCKLPGGMTAVHDFKWKMLSIANSCRESNELSVFYVSITDVVLCFRGFTGSWISFYMRDFICCILA